MSAQRVIRRCGVNVHKALHVVVHRIPPTCPSDLWLLVSRVSGPAMTAAISSVWAPPTSHRHKRRRHIPPSFSPACVPGSHCPASQKMVSGIESDIKYWPAGPSQWLPPFPAPLLDLVPVPWGCTPEKVVAHKLRCSRLGVCVPPRSMR